MNLKCPVCNQALFLKEKSFCCINNHTFDQSKQGYVNLHLSSSQKNHGDNRAMIQARQSFLSKGYYQPLKDQLNLLLDKLNPTTLVDCACGEGYYTKDFPCNSVLGIDLSKDAISLASRQDKKNQYIVSSIFNLPLFDESIDCTTTLFAPIATKEIERILKPNGYFVMVSVGAYHLFELKQAIYHHPRENDEISIDTHLIKVKDIEVKQTINIQSSEDIHNLFMMTPYYYKTSVEDKKKIEILESLQTTIHFTISIYRKRPIT